MNNKPFWIVGFAATMLASSALSQTSGVIQTPQTPTQAPAINSSTTAPAQTALPTTAPSNAPGNNQAAAAAPAVSSATTQATTSTLNLVSNSIASGGTISIKQVYKGFGCEGENLSPHLTWQGAPQDAKSLAITVYDPDAPTGSGWWHWVVFNIPVDTKEIPEGASGNVALMPNGAIESMTDYGKPGFGGACPPVGDKPHRYIVTLFALNKDKLKLDAKAPGALVGYFLNYHKIASATIEATYARAAEKTPPQSTNDQNGQASAGSGAPTRGQPGAVVPSIAPTPQQAPATIQMPAPPAPNPAR